MSYNKCGWIQKTSMTHGRSHFASAVYKGKIYCFGGGGEGFKSLNSVEFYDPSLNKWFNAAPMPTVRSGLQAATIGDEIYLIGGGFKGSDNKFVFFKTVEIYNPTTDSWRKGTDMLHAHDYPAVAVYDDKIYIIGGHHPDCTGGPLVDPGFDFCEIYDPQDEKWTAVPRLTVPRFALAATVNDNILFAMGGGRYLKEENRFINLAVMESLDPNGENAWKVEEKMSLPWKAAGAGVCSNNDNIYLFGGNSGDKIVDRSAFCNIKTGFWTELPTMDQPRIVMAAHAIGNSIFILGGRKADKKTVLSSVIEYFPQG